MRTQAEGAPHNSERTIPKMQFNPVEEQATNPADTSDSRRDI
jgi:hypothetical protein